MIVEFRVKNFRSFREEQVLSFVAAKNKSEQETNTISTGISSVPSLLGSTVIYGANASGKSNLIKAIQYMRAVVLGSATKKPGQPFKEQQFQLDADSIHQPSEFEITFIVDGVRHQYGFSLNSERIVDEYLLVYKSFKPQRWIDRKYNPDTKKDEYETSSFLKGKKSTWMESTRHNSLFLSMAVQLNSEMLSPVFAWFSNNLVVCNELSPLSSKVSINMLRTMEGSREICSFLNSADIDVDHIDVVTKKVPGQSVHFDLSTGQTEIRKEDVEENLLLFHHETSLGKATFNLGDESEGTRNLLFLAGPILDTLKKGLVILIDELDTSLHTLLVRRLIELFHDPEKNPNGAQLIFSTHDTSVLNSDIFNPDQIWFVEKDPDLISSLFSLVEFSPRKNEAIEKGYLMGRYGALPFFAN